MLKSNRKLEMNVSEHAASKRKILSRFTSGDKKFILENGSFANV